MHEHSHPPASGLSMLVETFGDVHEILLAGELDIASAGVFRRQVQELGEGPTVVDVSDLEFIDAAGLSALVLASRDRAPRNRLVVRGARGVVRRVIVLGGLEHLLVDVLA